MNRRTIVALAVLLLLLLLAVLLGPCVLTATPEDPSPDGSSGEPQDPDGGSTG